MSHRQKVNVLPAYLECVTKSYVGTSTTFPSAMSFNVWYIKSLSNASVRQTDTGHVNKMNNKTPYRLRRKSIISKLADLFMIHRLSYQCRYTGLQSEVL